jgi:hypothetical protein
MLTKTDPVHIELRDVQGKLPENKSLSHLKPDDEENFKMEARAKTYQENMNKKDMSTNKGSARDGQSHELDKYYHISVKVLDIEILCHSVNALKEKPVI